MYNSKELYKQTIIVINIMPVHNYVQENYAKWQYLP